MLCVYCVRLGEGAVIKKYLIQRLPLFFRAAVSSYVAKDLGVSNLFF
jgi:hypothetical protein